ncbi:MAG: hypothetical protein EBQ92_03030 [Proteobacteria bacterium]|nr:hypothetical protein [Pseudomonadota bacterium]
MGSVFLRRLDTAATNTVTVVAVINGVTQNILLPIGTDVVHQFTSVFDGQFGSTTFYFQQSSAAIINSNRVTRRFVVTISDTDLDITATNYIGLSVGGYELSSGDELILASQSNYVENAVYVVQSNGSVSRRKDFALGTNVDGYIVPVILGNYAGYILIFSNYNSGIGVPVIAGYDGVDVRPYISTPTPYYIGIEKYRQVLDDDYTPSPSDTIIMVELLSGVGRTLTLPKLSSLVGTFTTKMLKKYQIFKLAPSGVLTVNCATGDTFGDGSTSMNLQNNGDNVSMYGIISPTDSFWLIG